MTKLAEAMRAFERVLGTDKVLYDPAGPAAYGDPFAIDSGPNRAAGAIVPASVEEVSAALRIASQLRVPLWPISRGKNLGYGGAAPVLAGTLVLDLSRMRRIEFDETAGTVSLEPGVGFYDLHDFLRANDLPYWLSVPAYGWGSVVGNALDRGLGSTIHGDHARNIRGLEIVLADGDVVRTGMGAMAGASTWASAPHGFGPSSDQLFVQSNLGVVTRMGLWLMPEPESMLGLDVEFDRVEDLEAVIDRLGPLRRERVLAHGPTIENWLAAAAKRSHRSDWTDEPGPLREEVIETIRKRLGIGWWRVGLRLYGREDMTRAALAILEREMTSLAPMKVERNAWRKGEPVEQSAWTGTPSSVALQAVNWHGGRGGQVRWSTVLPQSGSQALAQVHRAEAHHRAHGFDYQTAFVLGERHLVNESVVTFDQDDPAMTARIDPLMRLMLADARAHGFGAYRTHLDMMELAARDYDFNGGALMRLNERLKDALDPAGIIAPGKSGIWGRDQRRIRSGAKDA